jgi:hypothetical protein
MFYDIIQVTCVSVTEVAYRDLDANWLSRGTEQDAKSQALRNFEVRRREGKG